MKVTSSRDRGHCTVARVAKYWSRKSTHRLHSRPVLKEKEFAVSRLVIVWRNPRLLRCCRRWQRLQSDSGRRLYVVHELVTAGNRRQWVYSSALEVLPRKVSA